MASRQMHTSDFPLAVGRSHDSSQYGEHTKPVRRNTRLPNSDLDVLIPHARILVRLRHSIHQRFTCQGQVRLFQLNDLGWILTPAWRTPDRTVLIRYCQRWLPTNLTRYSCT